MLPQKVHEQQKEALMEAVIKAVATGGMENLTTKEIYNLCGIKEVYIYRYFENKDDMVAKVFARSDDDHMKRFDVLFEKMKPACYPDANVNTVLRTIYWILCSVRRKSRYCIHRTKNSRKTIPFGFYSA